MQLPRPDQLTDFIAHRAVRAIGGRSPLAHRAWRLAGQTSGGRRMATYSALLVRLDAGEQPALEELLAALTTQLEAADRARARGHHAAERRLLDRALRLAFHPSAHYGPAGSPLMLQAERFLATLRASASARAFLFDTDPPLPRAERPVPTDRPLRVLVLCHASWTFVQRVIDDLGAQGGVEFRTVDLSRLPLSERPTHALAVRRRARWNRDRRLAPVPESLVEPLQWADTVHVEWGTYPFTWVSLLDLAPFAVRLVARLHRFEVLTPYPLLARSAAFDEITFVAPTVRRLMSTISPRLAQAGTLSTIYNVQALPEPAATDAPDRDRHLLLQVGWAPPVKDVLFSLDVLERLRREDPRYRLALAGHDLDRSADSQTAPWTHAVQRRLDALAEGVELLGYRDDVPHLLRTAGFLLSSSRVEGTHEAVAEAAASGCLPVVRNWPEMAPWGGAGRIYPAEWIVEDPEQAARRILALSDAAAYEHAADQAREWVLTDREPTRVRDQLMRFLRG